MAHDPRSIANYILSVRKHFGYETTQLELQKLLYFCHATFLVRYDIKLLDGYFEAWEHGPVHPLIYREFSSFKKKPITKKAMSKNLITGETRIVESPKDSFTRSQIVETVMQLRHLTAWQLREKSHAKGGPWHSVMESARINLASRVRIPDNVISERYHRNISSVTFEGPSLHDIQDYPFEPD